MASVPPADRPVNRFRSLGDLARNAPELYADDWFGPGDPFSDPAVRAEYEEWLDYHGLGFEALSDAANEAKEPPF